MQPGNGVVTEISPSSIAGGFALNPLSAIDPVNEKFFFGTGAGTLLSVDMNTGLADTIVLNINFPANFDLMQYNCGDSTLYGLYRTSSPAECYLAKADPATGQVTIISPSSIAAGYVMNAKSTLDPFNNIFYFFPGGGIIMGLDLNTGLPVMQTSITFSGPGQFFDLMAFNCNDGGIYGIARANSPAALYPARLNLSTGVVTNLSSNSLGQFIVLNAMSEINPFANVFHFFNGTSFISFDLANGNVLASPTLSFSSPPGNIYFDMIARDNCKCILSNPNLSIAETEEIKPMHIFPNPATAGTTVPFSFPTLKENVVMEVVDVNGKTVLSMNVASQVSNVTLNDVGLAPRYLSGFHSGRIHRKIRHYRIILL